MPQNSTQSATNQLAGKRLAVFLDGTWNTQDDNTNVWRLKLMCAPQGTDGLPQLAYYDPGVGTHWYDRLTGGAFGQGLDCNIRDAYQWLMEHYEDDDEVYVFGFSRGAYTARSLTGMIAKCGLLRPESPMPVVQVYERYSRGEAALPIYQLDYNERHKIGTLSLEEQWLLRHSRRIPIKFVGVWDTVGALGVPVGNIPGVSKRRLGFHFTRLSKLFQQVFQALAVDEQRAAYSPTLWTKFTPKEPDPKVTLPHHDDSPDQIVEQRWFSGAHADVGGGYRNDPVSQIPLAWIQSKAVAAGLDFRRTVVLDGSEFRAPIHDSYSEFLRGAYRVWRALTLRGRYYRQIGAPRVEKREGWVETVNETVDDSVLARWRADHGYRPRNVLEWAQQHGVRLDQ